MQNNIEKLLVEIIEDTMQGECHLFVTDCILRELKQLGEAVAPAYNLMKTMKVHRCNHKEELTPSQCIQQCIGKTNENKFVIASQDKTLKST